MTRPPTLDEIRARDAQIHYCATCHDRYYPDEPDTPHNQTVEQCEALLRQASEESVAKGGQPRALDPKTGRLCWNPRDHHPFVEGPIPDYEEAERDRRELLRLLDVAQGVREFAEV